MKTCKRRYLTLEERIKAIERLEKGESVRALAKSLGTGRMQVTMLLRNKDDIRQKWEAGASASRKLLHERKLVYPELDEKLYEWFLSARSRNIPTSGRLLQKKAIELAEELGIEGFCASNGWLDKFQKRKNIHSGVSNGDPRADTPEVVLKNWKNNLSKLCDGYTGKDIFTCAETCVFYGCTPGGSIEQIDDTSKNVGKDSDKRLTVLFCCSMEGEKLPPLVIGRFKILYKPLEQIEYQSNARAFMNKGLFEDWLIKWNNQLVAQQRNVILLLDRCSAHPYLDLSNIKMIFLPPNAKSVLQPLDAGIIQLVRKYYHNQLLSRIFQSASGAPLDSYISSRIHVLDALSWLSSAWEDIDSSTITSCFLRCGFGADIGQCDLGNSVLTEPTCNSVCSPITFPSETHTNTLIPVVAGADAVLAAEATNTSEQIQSVPPTSPFLSTIEQFKREMEEPMTVPDAIYQVDRIRGMAFSQHPELLPIVNDLLSALQAVREEEENRQRSTN